MMIEQYPNMYIIRNAEGLPEHTDVEVQIHHSFTCIHALDLHLDLRRPETDEEAILSVVRQAWTLTGIGIGYNDIPDQVPSVFLVGRSTLHLTHRSEQP